MTARVDYLGKKGQHLGSVEAPGEKAAIAAAIKTFHITPALRDKIMDADESKHTCQAV